MPSLRPVGVGDPAPAVVLPAVSREGSVALADYRGQRPVFVGLFRGLHCPFCRRQITQFGGLAPELDALGVATLVIVNTPLERARLYFRHRPTPALVLADPDAMSHRAFGLPAIDLVAREVAKGGDWPRRFALEDFLAVRINPTGELPEGVSPFDANTRLNQRDGFGLTPEDEAVAQTHGSQLAGHVLIDRDGIIRWRHAEAERTPEDLGRFPGRDELLAAARTVVG